MLTCEYTSCGLIAEGSAVQEHDEGWVASVWSLAPAPPRTTNTGVEGEGQGTPSAREQPVHRPAPACTQSTAAEPIRSSSSPLRAKEDRHRAAGAPREVAAARGRRTQEANHSAGLELIRPRSRGMAAAMLPM